MTRRHNGDIRSASVSASPGFQSIVAAWVITSNAKNFFYQPNCKLSRERIKGGSRAPPLTAPAPETAPGADTW